MDIVGGEDLCVYCEGKGPFTGEHMFPAGLGGDDKRFILEGVICGDCNTRVFSALEADYLRRTPIAIARLAFQDEGRDRGGKTKAPTLQTEVTEVLDTDSDKVYEAEMLPPFNQAKILPQILFVSSTQCTVTAQDQAELQSFIEKLRPLLESEQVVVISKSTEAQKSWYTEVTYARTGDAYTVISSVELEKVSKGAKIWLERVLDSALSSETHFRRPRLFQRSNGNYAIRGELSVVAEYLAAARQLVNGTQLNEAPKESCKMEGYSVHVGMRMKVDSELRVLAKIGLNLAIKVYGHQYVRHSSFAKIKKFILFGDEGDVKLLPLEVAKSLVSIAQWPADKHVICLGSMRIAPSKLALVLIVRLYGGPVQVVVLGENIAMPPNNGVCLCSVDYAKHLIELEVQ
jgi:hypothetical protein